MTAYVVAQISIRDRERYDRYARAFLPTLKSYGGRLLAADEAPEALEGAFQHGKLNLIAFPDKAAVRAWAASPEYGAIVADRLASSEGVVVLVEGPG